MHRWHRVRSALCAVAALITTAVALPAHAGWEYTDWHMSAADAVAASDTRLRRVDVPSDDVYTWRLAAIGWHRIGEDDFDVTVRETKATGRLEQIELRSEDEAACQRARVALVPAGASGKRAKWDRLPSYTWSDEAAGNDVWFRDTSARRRFTLFQVPDACLIIYRKLAEAASETAGGSG